MKNTGGNSNDEKFYMFVCGIYGAMCLAGNERNQYLNYKSGLLEFKNSEQQLDITILELLERNGFSIDELGTFLYKDVIKKTIECMRLSNFKEEELKSDLKNFYSQFYFDLSRNDRDMGLKSFHFSIQNAIGNLKEESEEYWIQTLFQENDRNYGEVAFLIGANIMESQPNLCNLDERYKVSCLEKK